MPIPKPISEIIRNAHNEIKNRFPAAIVKISISELGSEEFDQLDNGWDKETWMPTTAVIYDQEDIIAKATKREA